MARFKILIKSSTDAVLGEFNIYRNLTFGKKLNNYGTCKFELPNNNPKANSLVALRRYKVEIYRGDQLLWSGEQAIRAVKLTETRNNWVTITAYGPFEQLSAKYFEFVTVTAEDQGQLSSDLIDGGFGIVEGTIEETRDIDKEFENYNVADAVKSLANGGFDFEVNDSKVYNVYAFQGVDRSATAIIEYGVNITSAQITEDFSKIVTRAIVIGAPVVSGGEPRRIVVDDEDLQAIYGIREGQISELSVDDEATLEAKGQALIIKNGLPLIKVSTGAIRSGLTIADFALGDLIRGIFQDGSFNIDRKFRVFEWNIKVNEDDTEDLSVVLGDFNIPVEEE